MAKGKKGRKKKKGKKNQNTLWLSFVTVFVCVLALSLVIGTVFLLRIGERTQQKTGSGDAGKPAQGVESGQNMDDDSDLTDVVVYGNGKLVCRYEPQS